MRRTSLVTVAALIALLAACTGSGAGSSGSSASGASGAPAKPGRAAASSGQQAAPNDYFAGKTITVLVNFSAGGPTDIFARMVAAALGRHIPGQPKLVVENKAGAGGVIGANQLYNNTRPDGLTLGIFSSPFGNQVLEGPGVQYDAAKFAWLGGVNETSVTYIASNLGVKTARDLPRANGDIVVGGLSPDNTKDLEMRAFFNALQLPYKYVTGYPGAADVTLAVRRGEVNFGHDSLTSWMATIMPMVKEGEVVPVAQRGVPSGREVLRDSHVADIPTYGEVAVELKGEAVKQTVDYRAMTMVVQLGAMLRAMVYQPGTDAALVTAMRQAMADTFADSEFQAQAEKQLGFQFDFVPGAEAQEMAQFIIDSGRDDPEALAYLQRLSRDKN